MAAIRTRTMPPHAHYQHHHHSSSASASHAQPRQNSQHGQNQVQSQNHAAQSVQSSQPSQPSHQRKESRARESSIHALSATGTVSAPKATAQPSASFESATAESTPSPSSARDSLRSQTLSQASQAAHLKSADSSASPARTRTASVTSEKMGQGGSRPTPPQQSKTPPSAQPIDIQPATSESHPQSDTQIPPIDRSSALPDGSYFLHASEYSRAPRLPLPIGEEFYAPGSPILSPEELAGPIEPIGGPDEPIQRRSSVLSTTTNDTDDYGDDLDTVQSGALPPVPTLIEWRGPGTKIYVTGTFAGWDRKYRLNRKYAIPYSDSLLYLDMARRSC